MHTNAHVHAHTYAHTFSTVDIGNMVVRLYSCACDYSLFVCFRVRVCLRVCCMCVYLCECWRVMCMREIKSVSAFFFMLALYACLYLRKCLCACVCERVYVCLCVFGCAFVRVCVCAHACICFVWVYDCAYMCGCT
jgi:hypothetical protein